MNQPLLETQGDTQTRLRVALNDKQLELIKLFEDDARILGVWLFGSQVDGTATPQSDIDLGVLFTGEYTFDEQLEFEIAVCQILNTDLVDIVDLTRANLRLRFRAIGGELLYQRDFARVADYIEKTLIKYRDFEPRAQAILRDYFVTLKEESMRLDLKRIQEKIQFIQDNLALLKTWSAVDEAAFVNDTRTFYAAIHALQISIEAMLDTFSHILARLHLGAPTTDREMLEALRQKGLISQSHFQTYAEMSKFRNKVVHGYIDVDAKIIYQTMSSRLDDFELFFGDVKQIIETEIAREDNAQLKEEDSPAANEI
jgi:uncharacterized protein YutE (UPF0331/DUF86 family)/predicted nucleotidyltransferase